MRQHYSAWIVAVVCGLAAPAWSYAEKIEMKGAHLCCPSCIRAVGEVLSKADGVSDPKCDKDSKTITFTATDAGSGKQAVAALLKAGFYGAISVDGKAIEAKAPKIEGDAKADTVKLKDVHLCCGACKKAVTGLFKGSEVSFPGKNEVEIKGKDIDKAAVLESLRKAGFNGAIQ